VVLCNPYTLPERFKKGSGVKPEEENKRLLEDKKVKSYMKYSGMAFQIVAYLMVGVLLGKQLDKYFQTAKPYFTAGLAILFLGAYFVKLVADLSQKE